MKTTVGSHNRIFIGLLVLIMILNSLAHPGVAMASSNEAEAAAEEDVSENEVPVQTASTEGAITLGDVQPPAIIAEGAILMDADNGVILYQKNMDEAYFPASITKILTCLIAAENCSLSETVTFSKEAVFGIDRTSSNVGMDVGQAISMEEAILCVMLASANEVASAIAEHVSGSIGDFAELMNKRAEELGCTHTHFVNANGLPDEDHYTSPHDMALIAKAFNDNDTCKRLASMRTYDVAVTDTQPDEIHLLNHHKMYEGLSYAYEPVIWGKTGYTIAAGATLVTVAEKDGLSLICVVMKDASEKNYVDTRTLFDFGFNNYEKLNIAENDPSYAMSEADFFQTGDTTFGDTRSFITMDNKGFVIVPEGTSFSELESNLEYKNGQDGSAMADIIYTLNGEYVGETALTIEDDPTSSAHFGSVTVNTEIDENVRFVNIREILPYVLIGIVSVGLIILMIHLMKTYNFGGNLSKRMNIKKRRRRYQSDFDKIDF